MSPAPSLRIFVSSPGDVGREREMARKVCARVEGRLGGKLRLEAYFWEEVPMLANRGDFQTQIEEPASFDLVICILWSRLGSRLHPGLHRRSDGRPYASGTEYEFESAARAAQATGRPDLLVYRRAEEPDIRLGAPDYAARKAQWDALQEFCRRWFVDPATGSFQAAFNPYRDLAEFEDKLEAHLLHLAQKHYATAAGQSLPPSAAPRLPTWTGSSPYRGLQAFEMEHEPVFFGRTRARDEVLGLLRARTRCPFALIFGASGSGKSSLLRAGVLPWLIRPGVIEGVDRWRYLVWRPSDTPAGGDLLDGLAHALLGPGALPELAADGTDADALAALLRQNPEGAGLLLKGTLALAAAAWQREEDLPRTPVTRLALGLDQLEEAFTAAERFSAEARARFFRAISAMAGSGLGWTVATLRSDFFARCEETPELIALAREGAQYRLLPPGAAELSQMIRLPAEAAGGRFEEDPDKGRLEDALRDEALAEPGVLPLLEYALDELYRAGAARGTLTFADHAHLGGVLGALARRAEETFAALPRWAQEALDAVLRQLVRLGEEDEEAAARRTAPYAAATAGAGARELVEAFLAARLLVGDQNAEGERTVTVAHESLLRSWPRAAAWIQANRDFLRVRSLLGSALARWEEGARNADFLLPAGRPLAEAEDLLARHADALDAAEHEFIQASVARREAAARRRRRALSAVTVIFAALAAIAGWQWRQSAANEREANVQKTAAQTQTVRAEAQTKRATDLLAEAARNDLLDARGNFARGDQARALAQLARAMRYDPACPVGPAAVTWLQSASVPTAREIFLGHEGALQSAVFSPDGTRVLTVGRDQTARLWETKGGRPVGQLLRHEFLVGSAGFSPDGTRVLTTGGDMVARLWDAATGAPVGEPRPAGSAVFSPDGRRVLTAGPDGAARGWDAGTGAPVGEPFRHDGAVEVAEFSPDGKRVLTAGADQTARLWDAESGAPRGAPLRHRDAVRRAVFSPDGTRVLTVCADRTARLWEVPSGRPLGEAMRHEHDDAGPLFSADGARLLTIGNDRAAHLWDATSGKPMGKPLRHENMMISACFSPDGTRALTVSLDLTARLWDATSGEPVGKPMRHDDIIFAAGFSPDGARVLTASQDRSARVWDASSGEPLGEPLRHEAGVITAAFSPDGRLVLTASEDRTARLWDAQPDPIGNAFHHEGMVVSAVFSPDGTRVLTGSQDRTARLWDAATGKPLGDPLRHEDQVWGVAFSPDGARALTASFDKTARLWDARTGKPLGEPLRHEAAVLSAVFSPDGARVLTAGGDGTARLWDAESRRPLGVVLTHSAVVRSAVFSTDGTRALTACFDASASLWDLQTGERLKKFVHHAVQGRVHSAVFSPDGTRVLTASEDKTVQRWDARTGERLGAPLAHEGAVFSAVFSPDGARVLTASADRTARLWDAASGAPIDEPLRHESAVPAAVFSPDGTRVLTASADKTARIWTFLPRDAGPAPAWFAAFLRWRAQARLDTDGTLHRETGAEQAATRKELFDALAAIPAEDPSFYVRFARRFVPEDSPAQGPKEARGK